MSLDPSIRPMPDITFNQVAPDIDSLTKTTALIGYEDGNNVNVSLLSRYCQAPVDAAKSILNQINNVTDGCIRSLIATTYTTDQVLEESPDSIPPGRVLKFRAFFAGQDPLTDVSHTLSQFVPFAVFQDAEEYTEVGEGIAAILAADTNFEQVEFIKPRRR